MKRNPISKTGSPVLVFNPLKRLIGFFHSITAVATAFKTTNSSIYQACAGNCISCCGLYLRFLADDIEIENADYGTLKLEDYDDMCGVKRTYYPTASMSRKGMKYNKTKPTKK